MLSLEFRAHMLGWTMAELRMRMYARAFADRYEFHHYVLYLNDEHGGVDYWLFRRYDRRVDAVVAAERARAVEATA
jgi:hypothetical protein